MDRNKWDGWLLGLQANRFDTILTPQINVHPENETGMDRLKRMFQATQEGTFSSELTMITSTSSMCAMGGFIIGGIAKSRNTFINFIENNTATRFSNHLEAKRELTRVMYISMMTGGLKVGWRIGLFSLTFTTVMTAASVYWDKESILDYLLAGSITGGLFRAHLGFKGVIAGSFLGSILGGIGGTLSLGLLKLGGLSMADMRRFSRQIADKRREAEEQCQKEALTKESSEIKKSLKGENSLESIDEKVTKNVDK